jgi:hypothetical protein
MSNKSALLVVVCLFAVVMSGACANNVSSPTHSPTATLRGPAVATATPLPDVTSTLIPPAAGISTPTSLPPTSACLSVNGLPDHGCTPGAADPRVTQDNI